MARGYAASAPLPKIIPKPLQFVPYIFSHEELQRLLDASSYCENPWSKLQPYTCRMLILLLYGAALRISEALFLTLADVDLPASLLTIRESKFYKTRLVPMSPDLTSALGTYVAQRAKEHSTALDAALFLTRTSTPVVRNTAEHIFSRLRVRAGVPESCSLLRLRLASSNSRSRLSILFRSLNSRSSCVIRSSTICCKTFGSSGRCFGSIATVSKSSPSVYSLTYYLPRKKCAASRNFKRCADSACAAWHVADRSRSAAPLTPVP